MLVEGFQGIPYNAYILQLHTQVTLSKSRSENIIMPVIYSDTILKISMGGSVIEKVD